MKSNKKTEKKIIKKENIGIDVTNIITNPTDIFGENIDKLLTDKNNKIKLVSPYISMELTSNIELEAEQLNNEIYYNIKQNLIKKVEGKCNNIGYIVHIEKIIDYKLGYMIAEDFTGSCLYKIRYQALVCIPIKDTIIIGMISKKRDIGSIMIIQHGPIFIITKIKETDMNMTNFKLENNNIYSINKKQHIIEGDYVKIRITSIKYQNEDKEIKCMGILEDIANEDDINNYYNNISKKMINDSDNIKEDKYNDIEYNEDEMINEDNITKSIINSSTNYVNI